MSENLAHNLTGAAREHGDRPALRFDAATLTYSQLDDASARMARLLRDRGILPGDRVGIMLPNVPLFAIAYYGVLRAGGVVVPMNVLLKRREHVGNHRHPPSHAANSSSRWPSVSQFLRHFPFAVGDCAIYKHDY